MLHALWPWRHRQDSCLEDAEEWLEPFLKALPVSTVPAGSKGKAEGVCVCVCMYVCGYVWVPVYVDVSE